MLLRFTEQGLAQIGESLERAEAFEQAAEKAGAKVEAQYWTTGPYDGVMVISAPDDTTAAALVLKLGQGKIMHTCMQRTFSKGGFAEVLGKMR